jgi:copper chaperone NosL
MRDKRTCHTWFPFDGIARGSERRAQSLAWCLIVGVTVLTNCQKSNVVPVALELEDQCSYCRMAISEKRYAAELIDTEGQAVKFDDIGCMINFIKSKNNSKFVAQFVMDFDERQWIRAEDAYYIRSAELNSPMNGGVVAFKTQSQAEEAAARFHGQPLRFNDIFNR